MKKSLVALAVLGTFAGAAAAESSVTLYGAVEMNYMDLTGKDNFDLGVTYPTATTTAQGVKNGVEQTVAKMVNTHVKQQGFKGSRWGIAGTEDLGNGLQGVFRLEGALNADDGSQGGSRLFHREATVGLKGAFGEVKLGRAKSQMELAMGSTPTGHGVNDVDRYAIASARHSNGLFYEFNNSGFTFGADVTTKNGGSGNSAEDVQTSKYEGGKVNYGARIGYNANGVIFNAAYQNDDSETAANGATASVLNKQREYGAVLGFNLYDIVKVPVAFGVSYAQGEGSARGVLTQAGFVNSSTGVGFDTVYADKSQVIGARLGGYVSPNDSVYVGYRKHKSRDAAGVTLNDAYTIGGGYEHRLSKRTSAFADGVYLKAKNVAFSTDTALGAASGLKSPVDGSGWGYSFGVSHKF